MAGVGLKKENRSSFTSAGYTHGMAGDGELYIERVRAGSAQDLLRDNNRVGYRDGDALDEDGLPFSFFMEDAPRREQRSRTIKKKRTENERRLSLSERLVRAIRRERGPAALCCVLLAINLVLLTFMTRTMIDGVRKQNTIASYEAGAQAYLTSNEQARIKIDMANDGERVRNIAQNELGMLRKERVTTQEIYIPTTSLPDVQPAETQSEEKSGLLDWLLSVVDIFDF